jgi:HK97 family phage major capsid protein
MKRSIEEIVAEMEQLVQGAEGEGRMLTAEESSRFEVLNSEVRTAEASATVTGFRQLQPRVAQPAPLGGPTASWTVPGTPGATSSTGPFPIGGHADTVKAVATYIRTGTRISTMTNAMSIGSDADGGYEVPVQLDQDLQTVAAGYSPLLKLAKTVNGVTDGYRANVATTLPASAWKDETTARAVTASPAIAQIVPQRGAVTAIVSCTQWVMQDSYHELYSFLVGELGRQFGAAIGAAVITGANAQPAPKGLCAQTTAATADGARAFGTVEHIASGGANTAPTLDTCITALSHLHPFYQSGAAWLMSPSAAATLMTEKASTGGSYQWQPDLSASQPPSLFGKPVYIDPCLPAATTGNAYSVWIGDFSRAYVIVRYGRPILIRDDVTSKGNVLLYSEQRVGGNLVDSSALKAIKTAAA